VRVRHLLGLPEPGPEDREFGEEEVAAARSFRLFLEAGLGEEVLAELTRVMGESMSRLAAATAAAFVDAFLEAGDSEEDVAMRFATLAEELVPAYGPVLIAAYEAHLRESVRRGMIGRVERESGTLGSEQQLTVCFADLVGFTRLGGQVEARELGSVAGTLAELAADLAESPVRLVKTIGDAAMFVSQEPGQQVAVALSLVEAVEEADLPALRAGVACGPALLRSGDYYGNAVNVASRVTGIARPGSVLCTQEVRDAAPDDFDWSFAGKHRLRGVSRSVALHRARRLGTNAEKDAKRQTADRRRKRASS